MEPSKKTSCASCAGLIRLCSNLDYFPADAELRRLLVESLHHLAEDHKHAKAIIDRWLENETAAPKVANLASLAAQVRNGPALPDGCEICNGEWFVIHERGARCTCPRGETLRQLDRARESQEILRRAPKKQPPAFMRATAISADCGGINGP
jgi:hypothetical protein